METQKALTPGYFIRFHFIGITKALARGWRVGRVFANHLKQKKGKNSLRNDPK